MNQVRAWVRQGRTDAWIAHQLEVSASELIEFRRRHELSADDEETGELDLRDEIEAEIEATMAEEEDDEDEDEEFESESQDDSDEDGGGAGGREGTPRKRRRRRRRRGGGGGGRGSKTLEAVFDHGETDGYGLWLDPAVSEEVVYSENWAGQRKVEVTIEADRIVIRKPQASESNGDSASGD